METKTVCHWKNIFKSFGIVAIVGSITCIIAYFLSLPPQITILICFLYGGITMSFCMDRWDLFHFENNKKVK